MRFGLCRLGAALRLAVFAVTFFPADLAAVLVVAFARLATGAMTHSPVCWIRQTNLSSQYDSHCDTIDDFEVASRRCSLFGGLFVLGSLGGGKFPLIFQLFVNVIQVGNA